MLIWMRLTYLNFLVSLSDRGKCPSKMFSVRCSLEPENMWWYTVYRYPSRIMFVHLFDNCVCVLYMQSCSSQGTKIIISKEIRTPFTWTSNISCKIDLYLFTHCGCLFNECSVKSLIFDSVEYWKILVQYCGQSIVIYTSAFVTPKPGNQPKPSMQGEQRHYLLVGLPLDNFRPHDLEYHQGDRSVHSPSVSS